MNLELDLIAALTCGIVAVSCFTLHSTSSPSKKVWFNLPGFVRIGLVIMGCMATIRCVNFLSLSHGDAGAPGHANWEAVAAGGALAYLMGAMAINALRQTYPARIWDRIKAIHFLANCKPKAQALDKVVFPAEVVAEGLPGAVVAMPGDKGWTDPVTGERVDGTMH